MEGRGVEAGDLVEGGGVDVRDVEEEVREDWGIVVVVGGVEGRGVIGSETDVKSSQLSFKGTMTSYFNFKCRNSHHYITILTLLC